MVYRQMCGITLGLHSMFKHARAVTPLCGLAQHADMYLDILSSDEGEILRAEENLVMG